MDITLFVEQLETKAIEIIQEGLRNETISLARASEISNIVLSNLYPSMGKSHLLLARENFLKVPELKPVVNEIDLRLKEIP